jgi:tetratricopeptide (TPR) repeat protein
MVSISHDNLPILIEIEINPQLKTNPFADITQMSYYQNEDEVLIMLGALFCIQKVVEDKKNGMWIAHVSLASEDDYHLKETFAYMKETIGDDTNLDSLGRILHEMGEYRQAEKCYKRMLEEAQGAVGDARSGIGWAQYRCKEFEKSLEHLEQALDIRRQVLGENHVKVGDCFRRIGGVYWEQGNYKEALVNVKKAIEIHERPPAVDPMSLALTYHTAAIIYHKTNKTDLALQYYNKILKVQQANLPSDHPDIALTYNNLGAYYSDTENLAKALEYYEKSLHIRRKILPPTHASVVFTENNITLIKAKMKK